jgi:bifunctional non-homologous end joining protein LigD
MAPMCANRPSAPPRSRRRAVPAGRPGAIPRDRESLVVRQGSRAATLTHLGKPFWPALGLTKADLLRYYLAVAPALLPHLRDRPMVMKRYPDGAGQPFFFMKRAPRPRPPWLATCRVDHGRSGVIDFPLIQDSLALVWVVNLGCIDLNPWYARCDDLDRPDFLHFDLDPTPATALARIAEAALETRRLLAELAMPVHVKTSGSRGLHLYVPIVRGPTQREVWALAKALALELARRRPDLVSVGYRVARRPPDRVVVDYNQNAWGRTLASVYSVRPTARATVSTPVTWTELERGLELEAFRIDTVPARIRARGDLWKPLLEPRRYDLAPLVGALGRSGLAG